MTRKHIWMIIAMCGLVSTSIGVAHNVAGLYYTAVEQGLGVGRAAVAMTDTISVLVSSVICLLLPRWISDKSINKIVVLATALLAGSTALLAACSSVWQMYVLCVLRGIGEGLSGFVFSTFVINKWFYSKRGLITSIVMMFSGLPGVLLSSPITSVIQNYGWRTGYLFSAAVILVLNAPALFVKMSVDPVYLGYKPYEKESEKTGPAVENRGLSAYSIGIDKKLLTLTIIFNVAALFICAYPSHFPGYAESIGFDAATGSLAMSFSMAASIISKLIFGELVDRMGGRKSIIIFDLISLAGSAILLAEVSGKALLYVGVFLFTFTFCNSSVSVSITAGDLFGLENYNRIYPKMVLVGNIVLALTGSVIGILYDATGSYRITFIIGVVMQITIAAVTTAAYSIREKQCRKALQSSEMTAGQKN
ncbi:MAG: MFS transporter [Oscillospiraceae bacterium]|jgi:MFS family permease